MQKETVTLDKQNNTYFKAANSAKLPFKTLKVLVAIYVFLMLCIYPLSYENKYFNMGEAKWHFYSVVTVAAAVLIFGALIWWLFEYFAADELMKLIKSAKLVPTDYFAIAYLVSSCISSIITPYKQNVVWGYDGWYMGLIAQVSFVIIYFLISRLWRWDGPLMIVYLGAAFLVFFFGVIMKFRIDPLEMYVNLEEMYVKNFLSTLGQATWYSSYMVILAPLGIVAYMIYDKLWQRISFGIFTAISFMTMATQNSDSAYIAFAAMMMVLFWVSFSSNKRFVRLWEVLVICFASWKFIGIMQILNADTMVELDELSIFMSQSSVTSLLLVLSVIALVVFTILDQKQKLNVEKFSFVRIIVLVLVVIGVAGGVTYICLNSLGKLPENLSSDNNYLLFNEFWGNNRGSSWTVAMGTFLQGDIVRKLFGAGPDCFYEFVYTYYRDVLAAKWGADTVLTCAHNEWLNSLLNMGIIGCTAYIGIFVAAFRRFMKKAGEYPEVMAICVSIAAYMGHNFFCYQQIICTPIIFILIGGAEALVRYGYEENAEEDKKSKKKKR